MEAPLLQEVMAYSRKFTGLFTDTLGYPYVADLTDERDDEIVRMVAHCFENRERLKEKINNSIATSVQAYYDKFNATLSELLQL